MRIIEVVPYNPNWPSEFKTEAEKIKQALGDNCIEVHHIGSTSVPGMATEPIIDNGLGITYDYKRVDHGSNVNLNDDLVLWFTKRL